jgi:hypothetical protein
MAFLSCFVAGTTLRFKYSDAVTKGDRSVSPWLPRPRRRNQEKHKYRVASDQKLTPGKGWYGLSPAVFLLIRGRRCAPLVLRWTFSPAAT